VAARALACRIMVLRNKSKNMFRIPIPEHTAP
jgi:hypothetical protein